MLASALVRRAGQAGGNAVVLARGDATAGAIVILCRTRGQLVVLLERILDRDGYAWRRIGPALDPPLEGDSVELQLNDWIAARRSRDPDLWVVELDIADSERFAAGIDRDG